jgi:hypothetical protein
MQRNQARHLSSAMSARPPNSALLTDAYLTALRALSGAAKRERWASKMSKSPFEAPPAQTCFGA